MRHPDDSAAAYRHLALHRRSALQLGGALGAAWLTPLARLLAEDTLRPKCQLPPRSLIVLWLAGGPSQLETFDPHQGKRISGDTRAIKTAVPGIELGEGLVRTAERMESIALVRSVVSKEGDHERGTYAVKTGYRPDPTAVHPSIGAILCHELPHEQLDIPRHISILSGQWPARGGFLGNSFDAFRVGDPAQRIADVSSHASELRYQRRLDDLDVLERHFATGRRALVAATGHREAIADARRLMTSEQLKAFDVAEEHPATRAAYGSTPFGRGCLAARRLVDLGVRCVEVTLAGWDSHANNHEVQSRLTSIVDPALAALIDDLKLHETWNQTLVLVAGEFGRTPSINRLGGRDHWPHGFSVALAGGAIRGGTVVGATDPDGGREVQDPRPVADIHATLLAALGLDPARELISPAGRALKLSEGRPIDELLACPVD
jgi:uncharacterized protein (DUF1501 family)